VWKAAGDRSGVAYALSNLGRLAYRRGSYVDAIEMLEEARAVFLESGADADAVEAEARIGECALMAGRTADALKTAEGLLRRVTSGAGASGPLTAMLYRLKGSALVHMCDFGGAEEALEHSIQIAKARGATYDVALTLGALAGLAAARGVPGDGYLEERKAILEQIGVVKLPGEEVAV
jgi:tetratricopeptide (TPR) repeat protein